MEVKSSMKTVRRSFKTTELRITCNLCGASIGLLLGKKIEKKWKLEHECSAMDSEKPFIRNELGTHCRYCGESIGQFASLEQSTKWASEHKCL